jgi:hypothetical protein
MSIQEPGAASVSFKWYYRPEASPTATIPVVHIVESTQEVSRDELVGLLREIPERSWGALRQLMLEAKTRSEAQLRDENVIAVQPIAAYYAGGIAHLDYLIANLEGIRAGAVGIES